MHVVSFPGRLLLHGLCALISGLLTACGGEAGAASLQRLELAVVPGSPPLSETRVAASFDMLGERERWTSSTADVAPGKPKDAPRTPEALMLRVGRGGPGQRIVLNRAGSYDPRTFNEVRLTIVSGGTGTIGISLRRGGETVAVTTSHPIPVGGLPRLLTFSLPARHGRDEPYDELAIEIDESLGNVFLRHVELRLRPLAGRLPAAEDGPRLVALAGDGRSGVGLSAGRPLEADVAVPPGAFLSFSYAWPPLADLSGSAPRVAVTVRGPAGAALGESFVLRARPGGARWEQARMSLAPLAGETARVRFELVDDALHDASCVIAEAAVWTPGPAPPSVLLVTSDTHRADHVSAAPRAVLVRTPALAALAARGVLFEDCFVPTNVTNPSHMALLTGAHPRDIGIHGNNQVLADGVPTLARHFAAAGYVTRAVLSAQHLGDPESGLGQGFDRMAWPELPGIRSATDTIALAREWLVDVEGRAVFLWVHLFDAHTPYRPPQQHVAPYYPRGKDPFDEALPDPGIDTSVLGPGYEGLRDLDYARASYKGEISYLDAELGRLLSADVFDEGILAVTADHGESLGQHGIHFTHAGLYPDSLHVPLLLAWPGGPSGQRVAGAVSQLDLGRTLLELAGLPADEVPGRSLLEQLDGAAHEGRPRFALSAHRFSASVTHRGLHLMLHLEEQQHRTMTSRFERHQVQLFDLAADPGCEHDLVDERPAEAADLRARLIAWLDARRPLGWTGAVDDSEETRQRLAALGYLQGAASESEPLWEPDDCGWCQRFEDAGH